MHIILALLVSCLLAAGVVVGFFDVFGDAIRWDMLLTIVISCTITWLVTSGFMTVFASKNRIIPAMEPPVVKASGKGRDLMPRD